jgi:hypothetical protein
MKIKKLRPVAETGLNGPDIPVDFEEDECGDYIHIDDLYEWIYEEKKGALSEQLLLLGKLEDDLDD